MIRRGRLTIDRTYRGWKVRGGPATPGTPVTAVSRSADRLDIFVVGKDGRLYTAAWEPAFADRFHGWWHMGC
jgi:hypothetical protein